MLKIQYGIAGFFTGAFTGLLLGLVEMRIIDNLKHPAGLLFILIALTIMICGISGLLKGLNIARKKIKADD
ncbi:MAG: hypothetical protein ABI741_10740 [Ferruginibacter sp.]